MTSFPLQCAFLLARQHSRLRAVKGTLRRVLRVRKLRLPLKTTRRQTSYLKIPRAPRGLSSSLLVRLRITLRMPRACFRICGVGIRWLCSGQDAYSNKFRGYLRYKRKRMALDWGYDQHNGPEEWCKYYPDAGGAQQSPIDVNTSSIMTDIELLRNPLTWNYTSDICTNLQNTGKGWQVCVEANGCSLEGGPLQHHYQLQQFHCHWGASSKCGSEHTVDGQPYSGELHLVHWNVDLFANFKEAARSAEGLAVLGVLLKPGQEHQEMNKLTRLMKNIKCKGETTPISEKVSPVAFIPDDHSYWTYQGSLTTPPCYESVSWILFKQPIEVSEQQLEEFRKLLSQSPGADNQNTVPHDCILKNHRPPQPLHDRLVRFATSRCN